jgi:hypothetical protein
MFLNTVSLQSTSATTSVALIDGPTNQKTLRSSADALTLLSVAHQETSENGKGIKTQRSNVRVQISKEIEDTGVSATGYVQFTMSLPRDVFTAADAQKAAAQLINFLLNEAGGCTVANADCLSIPRLYAGEP